VVAAFDSDSGAGARSAGWAILIGALRQQTRRPSGPALTGSTGLTAKSEKFTFMGALHVHRVHAVYTTDAVDVHEP
jgi:hypothetical protein